MEPLSKERSDELLAYAAFLDIMPQWSRSRKSGVTLKTAKGNSAAILASMEPLSKERSCSA